MIRGMAAKKFEILVLNQISQVGLKRLPEKSYKVAKESAHPDAILVRSHDMNAMAIPASVRAIGRLPVEEEPDVTLLLDAHAVAISRDHARALHVRDELREVVVVGKHRPGDVRVDLHHRGRGHVDEIAIAGGADRDFLRLSRCRGERQDRDARGPEIHTHGDSMPQRIVLVQPRRTYFTLTPVLCGSARIASRFVHDIVIAAASRHGSHL